MFHGSFSLMSAEHSTHRATWVSSERTVFPLPWDPRCRFTMGSPLSLQQIPCNNVSFSNHFREIFIYPEELVCFPLSLNYKKTGHNFSFCFGGQEAWSGPWTSLLPTRLYVWSGWSIPFFHRPQFQCIFYCVICELPWSWWDFYLTLGFPSMTSLLKKLTFVIILSNFSVRPLSHVWLFATPWTAACQAFLSITNSWSLL